MKCSASKSASPRKNSSSPCAWSKAAIHARSPSPRPCAKRSEEHTSELQSPIDTSIDTLSLHDALPISPRRAHRQGKIQAARARGQRRRFTPGVRRRGLARRDRKSTRLNSSHQSTRRLTLFPYTTLFRSRLEERIAKEKFKQPVRVVKGGDSRQESVAAALREVPNDTEIVLVHDAVRPFVTVEQITRVIEEARRCHAAILGIPAMDTVKEVKRASLPEDVALVTGTIPRERLVMAQTPQVFATKLLKEALARAQSDGVNASDEAGLVERLGRDVHVVLGSERNMKITKPADMELARFYLDCETQKA